VILLTGENGSGKTTLLKSILRLHGKGTFEKQDGVIRTSRRLVGYLGQRPQTQILTFKVEEELVTPLSFATVPREQRREVIRYLSSKYGIGGLLHSDPHRLSSGQLQLILSLVNQSSDAELLLLDEPFALLDEINRDLLISGLLEMKKRGIGIVLVSHNLTNLDSLVDCSYRLESGEITEYSPDFPRPRFTMQLKEVSDVHHFHQISMGYTSSLLSFEDLQIPKSGVLLVTGPNGSGKTLFLLSLSGIIKPIQGAITSSFSRESYLLLQDTHLMYWRPTLLKEWMAGTDLPYPSDLGIPSERSPLILSPGELKQFGVELAFSSGKAIIVLDEPNYSLDSSGKRRLISLIKKYTNEKLIVISSNDLSFIQFLASDNLITSEMNLSNYRRNVDE